MMADVSQNEKTSQWEHIHGIFSEYTTPSRVLRSFTNLSNTVIQTALSGQSKFIFEILQNADDAFEDPDRQIEVHFTLEKNYLTVNHDGKGFDYNDVERICDYASQIEEVKATDLSKTGYKGLGFKSLFNLSECIYIRSNGYSFRFDKSYWPDSECKPWQVIPIWCDSLPLSEKFSYSQPVNLVLKIKEEEQLKSQLQELVEHPELLLFLHRINKLKINLNGKEYHLERKSEKYKIFSKVVFYNNNRTVNTWLLGTYESTVPSTVQSSIQGGSKFVYPDKIKTATKVPFTFSLRVDDDVQSISKVRGILYGTLPTQLHFTLPYHINSLFVLNLDRTQLHENEWNVFLVQQIGYLQLILLKELAQFPGLKNHVIELFVREISHPYTTFCDAFVKGYKAAKNEISWLPAYKRSCLLKIGEAWVDETEFFKRHFQHIQDNNIEPYLIDYDVKNQDRLLTAEATRFTYDQLLQNFRSKYYPQLLKESHKHFIRYLYESWKNGSFGYDISRKLRNIPFLKGKNGELLPPEDALLEDCGPVPDYFLLNTVDNEYLHAGNIDSLKKWLVDLGAKRLSQPIQIIRESILKWIDSRTLHRRLTRKNHLQIMKYLAENVSEFSMTEIRILRDNLLILTKDNQFKLAKECYVYDAVVIKELEGIISDENKISPSYDTGSLRYFFIQIGVKEILPPVEVLRKSILSWIKNDKISSNLRVDNYYPIIEYFASCYSEIEHHLEYEERKIVRSMPVLTCSQAFRKAEDSYMDTVIPKVKGLENIIQNDKLVWTETLSEQVKKFLSKIGVAEFIDSSTVLRFSVLKWIEEGHVDVKVTTDNHLEILGYIAEHWNELNYDLKDDEIKSLRRFPILTKNNTFKEACNCYWPESDTDLHDDKIPGIENLISADELVSPVYEPRNEDKKLNDIKRLIKSLGVKSIKFTDIYEKYSDHLKNSENLTWFFSQLVSYWKKNNSIKSKLLKFVQQKFTSPCLLGKDGKLYCSKELYSSQFYALQKLAPNIIPMLDYAEVPKDLEDWLGFKDELELPCMLQLLEAIDKQTELGEEETLIFFRALLDQLKLKDEEDIKKHNLKLLSQKNELKLASSLYYFEEEDVVCVLDSCYLKRIHGMSHDETLRLASLCGVNILPFQQEIHFEETPICDKTFKEFYLERLPLIALQESKKLNESPISILKRLYTKINSIELYRCISILLKYPFGNLADIWYHFENSKIYVVGEWKNLRSIIHEYVKVKLCLASDITVILDMDTIREEVVKRWLHFANEDFQKLVFVIEELQKLLTDQERCLLTAFENMILNAAPRESNRESKPIGDNINLHNEEHSIDRTDFENEKSDTQMVSIINKQESKSLNLEKLCSFEKQLCELLPNIELQQGKSFFKHESDFKTEEHVMNEDSGAENRERDQSGCEEKFHLVIEIMEQLLLNPEKMRLLALIMEEKIPINNEEENISENDSVTPLGSLNSPDEIMQQRQSLLNLERMSSSTCTADGGVEFTPINNDNVIMEEKMPVEEENFSENDSATVRSLFYSSEIMEQQQLLLDLESMSSSTCTEDGRVEHTSANYDSGNFSDSYSTRYPHSSRRRICHSQRSICKKQYSRSYHDVSSLVSNSYLLSEQSVYIFLQEYYKNKYPDSQISSANGTFKLTSQSAMIEIIWLNENEELSLPYDLLLKKDGEVKQIIEVISSDEANDSFGLCRDFINKSNTLAGELYQYKNKYCMYRVFIKYPESASPADYLQNISSLYKIVPLKI